MVIINKTKNIIPKIIAIIIVFLMTFSNIAFIGNQLFTYAADINKLDKQDNKTKNENIEFDAFFKVEQINTHQATLDSINNDNNLYISLNVKESGYLKDAKIHFTDEQGSSNTNFEIENIIDDNNLLAKFDKNTKEMLLNQVNSETYNLIQAKIGLKVDDIIEVNRLNNNNKLILKGTYVNEKAKEIKIEKEIIINTRWKANTQIILDSQISKYVQYNVGEEKGVLLTTNVIVEKQDKNTNQKMNTLPIKKITIQAEVPTLNGVEPTYVKVVSNNTTATNGKTGQEVLLDWEYNKEDRKVTINVDNNIDIQNKIWMGLGDNLKDEYEIIYLYPEQAYNQNAQTIVNTQVKATIDLYKDSNEIIQSEKQFSKQEILTDNIEDILTYQVKTTESGLSKGDIYSNYTSNNNENETEYNVKWLANIGYADIIDQIILQQGQETFSNAQTTYPTLIGNENITYIKETKINKQNMLDLLGEQGKIEIFNQSGEKIAQIDNQSQTNSQNEIVIDYKDYNKTISNISIKTTKPITEGTLEFEHKKSIKSKMLYNLEDVRQFKTLDTALTAKIVLNKTNDEKQVGEMKIAKIALEETRTNANLYMSKTTLSTIVNNENVEIKIELNNNTKNSDLYKNPEFNIIFPPYIEEVNIKDINILFDDELKIQSVDKYLENGQIVVKIKLQGTQTKFSSAQMVNGTNIVLNTDIKAKLITPAIQEQIKLIYINENTINYYNQVEGKGESTLDINFAAPTGVISSSSISNFDNSGKTVTSVEQGEIIEKIQIFEPARTALATLRVINNSKDTCNDVVVLGKIAFKGNKSIVSGEELATTLDTTLKSKISVEGISPDYITIYYSENGEATTDLINTLNGWTRDPQDITKIKSFMVIANGYELNPYSMFTLKYEYEIPANIEHNNSMFADFVTYYRSSETQNIQVSESDKVGLTTGPGPQLKIETAVSVGNETIITEGQRVKYYVKVTNTGNEIADNVVIKAPIPKGTIYTKYLTGKGEETKSEYVKDFNKKEISFELGSLQPGEERTEEYEVEVNVGETDKVTNICTVIAKDLSKQIPSNTVSNNVEATQVIIDIESSISKEQFIEEGTEITYNVIVRNTDENNLSNIQIQDILPDGIIYKDAYKVIYNEDIQDFEYIRDTVNYNSSTRTVTWEFDNIPKQNYVQVKLIVEADKLKENEYDKKIINKVVVTADEINTIQSNDVENTISRARLVIGQTCSKQSKYLAVGEELEYNITIKNEGNISTGNIVVIDELPQQLKVTGLKYKLDDKETISSAPSNGIVKIRTSINPGQTLVVNIKVMAFENVTEETSIRNIAKVVLKTDEEMFTNEIVHILEPSEDSLEEQEPQKPEEKKYKITGTAWLDDNKNGAREASEQLLSNINLKLINSVNNEIIATTNTNDNGTYIFDNLAKDSYFIIFEYDTNIYELTEYQKEGVSTELNSDAIETNINQNGVVTKVAITDTIKIETTSISGIDIGLTTSPKFDLRLDKYVNKITVQNSQGTKTTTYGNEKLAKIDIDGRYLAGSLVIVEYKIVVTNEGTIAGYAKNIVDYIPSGMKFNSELNTDWYTGQGGNLYTIKLKDTLIAPGQTKEIVLLLTKNMTDSNTGLINNVAEIAESYNQMGFKDIDSTEANKMQGEDDMSSCDVLISIKTGEIIIYILSIIIITAVIGVGIYIIKKKISRRI